MSSRRWTLLAILANEARGIVMTAPAWFALWRHWTHH